MKAGCSSEDQAETTYIVDMSVSTSLEERSTVIIPENRKCLKI